MGDSPSSSEEKAITKYPSPENPTDKHILPTYNHNGRLVTKGINPEGESGRSGFHPFHFFRVIWRSSTKVNTWLNLLWPFVPAALALYFIDGDRSKWEDQKHGRSTFALSFIGIVPAASTLDFAGQQFAKKLPRVAGIVIETFLGGIVEIILVMILLAKDNGGDKIPVIKAAILGSILANILLCLGGCFFVGGLKYREQKFHKIISEVGSGILLVAAFGLFIPSAFYAALNGVNIPDTNKEGPYNASTLAHDVLDISKGTSFVLWIAFFLYLMYNVVSHDTVFDEVLNHDEERDRDREEDLAKSKLTLLESIIAIFLSLAFVSLMAYILVQRIDVMVEKYKLPENFLGLILVPVVEKAAEHLSALDEAYDNQINFALFHCLGPTVLTALFTAPLTVFVGWGLGKPMDLNFEIFMIGILVLAIIVVGNVLRDGASDYLEGAMLMLVYVIIAIAAYHYRSVVSEGSEGAGESSTSNSTEGGEAITAEALALAKRFIEAGLLKREL